MRAALRGIPVERAAYFARNLRQGQGRSQYVAAAGMP